MKERQRQERGAPLTWFDKQDDGDVYAESLCQMHEAVGRAQQFTERTDERNRMLVEQLKQFYS